MFKEIKSDILNIVWRFKWQLSINDVINEYHETFELSFKENDNDFCGDEFLKTREEFEHNTSCSKKKIRFNYCVLSNRCHELNIQLYDDEFFFIPMQHIDIIRKSFMIKRVKINLNYIYTSTKYLREIKESGIKCISLIDNA